MVKKNYAPKEDIAIAKHRADLRGTGYECCADCPGAAVKSLGKDRKGKMGCSRVGGCVAYITPEEAQKCNGDTPFPDLRQRRKTGWQYFKAAQELQKQNKITH